MDYVLKTEKLTKEYSHTKVVDSIFVTVKQGDIYGFVGKNGAGKTTFIRIVLGLANQTEGTFEFFGGENLLQARKHIGSLIESPALYTNMTARENLNMFCTMLGTDKKEIDTILETVGLVDTGKKKARDFSLGMKQRLGIAIALLGRPELMVLDEPINGLDPEGIVEVRELLRNLNREQKVTILISSHILSELSLLCTDYIFINHVKSKFYI